MVARVVAEYVPGAAGTDSVLTKKPLKNRKSKPPSEALPPDVSFKLVSTNRVTGVPSQSTWCKDGTSGCR